VADKYHSGKALYTDNGTREILGYDNLNNLGSYHHGDIDILFRYNRDGIPGKNPLPTDEGIRKLL